MEGFKEGELILSSSPYAYVLHDKYRGEYCDYCFQDNDELKRCSKCSYVYYCDRSCQEKAWELHKMECKFLKRAGSDPPCELTRLIALVFMKVKKCGYDEPFEKVGDRKVSMASLMSHAEEIKKLRNGRVIPYILNKLKNYIGSSNIPSVNESAEIYGKIHTNVFGIEHVMGAGGTALYLGPSVFDHSCDPEADYTFDGITLNIRMRKNVPHRDIKQIHISYFNVPALKEERQKELWDSKFFHCECSMCTSPKMDDLLTKLVDDKPETKEKALKCKEDLEELLSNGPSLKEPQLLYDRCKALLQCQSGVLADTNIYKLRTLEKALAACSELKKHDDAVEIAFCLEQPYRLYFGTNHPKLAYFLFDYGQSLYYLKHYQEAVLKLCEAGKMLKVTHGEQHPILDIVASFIDDCLNQQ